MKGAVMMNHHSDCLGRDHAESAGVGFSGEIHESEPVRVE